MKCALDFVRRDLPTLTPDMPLASALKSFMLHQGERLPVIESASSPVLLGVVYKTTLLEAYVRMSAMDPLR